MAHSVVFYMQDDLGTSEASASAGARGLDPADWSGLRALGHRIIDDLFDGFEGLADAPVWRQLPAGLRAGLRAPLDDRGVGAEASYAELRDTVMPYASANNHPGFMGWVQGGGTAVGMLAELIAAGLNPNCGGRDHAGIELERQVIGWSARMLGLPEAAGGVLTSGSSIANFIGVLAARTAALGPGVRAAGIAGAPLVAYAGTCAHGCVPRALDMAGLGTDALRAIPAAPGAGMDAAALRAAIEADRAAGRLPFLVVATAGSVDTGGFDDLGAIAAICAEFRLWLHVDAAFGAFAALSPALAPLLAGIERADSVAFDFHKLGQVPYDAGCVVVRDVARLSATFAQSAAYLGRESRGLAANSPWPCDLGPELSRGFRALKVWMTIKSYGAARLGAVTEAACAVARALGARIAAEPALELLAPVAFNIVCFAPRGMAGAAVRELVADVQESGVAAPSTTIIDGRTAIRAAIVNHRTTAADTDRMVDAVLARIGK